MPSLKTTLAASLAMFALACGPAAAADPSPPAGFLSRGADFGAFDASIDARYAADRIVESDDNGGRPFAIVDKKAARIFLFNAAGQARAASTALIGLAFGDTPVADMGRRSVFSATVRAHHARRSVFIRAGA